MASTSRVASIVEHMEQVNARFKAEHEAGTYDMLHRTFFCKGGRTGTKIHRAHAGSSVLGCGIWVKANVSYFEVKPAQVRDQHLCEKCFGPRKPVEAAAPQTADQSATVPSTTNPAPKEGTKMATTRTRKTAPAKTTTARKAPATKAKVDLPGHSDKTKAQALEAYKAEKAGKKRTEIAEQLGVQPNRAWYLTRVGAALMGEAEVIPVTDDASAKKHLPKLRKEGLSWGEISARSGFSEGRLKVLGEELGLGRQLEGRGGRTRSSNGAAPEAAPAKAPAKGKTPAKASTGRKRAASRPS